MQVVAGRERAVETPGYQAGRLLGACPGEVDEGLVVDGVVDGLADLRVGRRRRDGRVGVERGVDGEGGGQVVDLGPGDALGLRRRQVQRQLRRARLDIELLLLGLGILDHDGLVFGLRPPVVGVGGELDGTVQVPLGHLVGPAPGRVGVQPVLRLVGRRRVSGVGPAVSLHDTRLEHPQGRVGDDLGDGGVGCLGGQHDLVGPERRYRDAVEQERRVPL